MKYTIKQVPAEHSYIDPMDYMIDGAEMDNIFVLAPNNGYGYHCINDQDGYSALRAEWEDYIYDTDSGIPFVDYLNFDTGKTWDIIECRGYCQGNYVEILYRTDLYSAEDIRKLGDLYLGCYMEFFVIYPDGDEIYGFYVTDEEALSEEDYKKIVCDQAGIPYDETVLMLVSGAHTVYDYVEV